MPSSYVDTFARVNYSETDQMGVVYHARYAVWLDIARTEYLRQAGMSYRDLEAMGFFLAVVDRSPCAFTGPPATTTGSGSAAGCASWPAAA